jgi:hypothetical protein
MYVGKVLGIDARAGWDRHVVRATHHFLFHTLSFAYRQAPQYSNPLPLP